jgi:general secretion pathway protein E
LENLQLYKPGKSAENPYGFKGQIPLREQFLMTGEIRTLLESGRTVISAQEIEAAAAHSGMRTMLQDGILKVVAGITTMDEIFRVVG